MIKDLTRRDFIKTTSLATLGLLVAGYDGNVDAASVKPADLVVCGKIFTSENNQIVEAFAVKDGKYVYVGDKKVFKRLSKKARPKLSTTPAKGLLCLRAATVTRIIR